MYKVWCIKCMCFIFFYDFTPTLQLLATDIIHMMPSFRFVEFSVQFYDDPTQKKVFSCILQCINDGSREDSKVLRLQISQRNSPFS